MTFIIRMQISSIESIKYTCIEIFRLSSIIKYYEFQ